MRSLWKKCYSTFVPTLGLADYGDGIEEAVKREIPVDDPSKELVTELQV
ncbi:MAG: hypothetical protein WD187_02955 [Candidatus Woykebacteria bacterium]